MNVRDTFFDRDVSAKDHLYVVIAKKKNGSILTFNLTTRTDPCDMACPIEVGDHPWVTKPSIIYYRGGAQWDATQIAISVDARLWVACTPVTTELLERIRKGAFSSQHCAGRHRDFLKDTGYNPIPVVVKRKHSAN